MSSDLFSFEHRAARKGFHRVAGVDEAGRGPLAGPVVAAAVILDESSPVAGLDDSKRLTPARRRRLLDQIYQKARCVGIGIVDAIEIDRINILQASLLAMRMAVDNLKPTPDLILIDGPHTISAPMPEQAIVKGDSLSASVAAASIVAKETRDRLMVCYDAQYPQFGFAGHKGYPTQKHRAAIREHGRCPIHRKSFKGVVAQNEAPLNRIP